MALIMNSKKLPYAVIVHTESLQNLRVITDWCFREFEMAYDAARNPFGTWAQASVTLDGNTKYGFKTEDMKDQFIAAWPDHAIMEL